MDTFVELMARLKSRERRTADLSTAEDLSLAVMNLISLEESLFFKASKTGDPKYFKTQAEAREERIALMKKLLPETEGETWCATKHLLSAAMRLIEVGAKLQKEDRNQEALEMFQKAYHLYSIFGGLKLKLLSVKAKPEQPNSRLEDLLGKLADCCGE